MSTDQPSHAVATPAAIPGPADRVHFLDEQRRRRRQTWRFTALCALTAALVGVPFAMFITPFLFFLILLMVRAADGIMPIPAAVLTTLGELAAVVPAFLTTFADSADETLLGSLRDALALTPFPFGSPVATLVLLLAPSMAAVVAVWLAYRSLFRSAGVGGELLALGAREPRSEDLEERQLVNLTEEVAIAAGLPPTRVRLVDSSVPNAAVIGSGVDDAVIIVTRGLLDRMDRDETQGVIAHLAGSVGNGDNRIALSLTTVFQTIELCFTSFDALINLSRSAWRDLFRVIRCAATGGRDPRAAEAVAALLDHRLGEWRNDGVSGLFEDAQRDAPVTLAGRVLKRLPFLYVLLLPSGLLYIPFMLLRMQVYLFRLLIVGPLVMMVWRTRRHLADATAVQLTRNPDALARALARLAAEGAVVPGGQWFAHVFIIGPEAVHARNDTAFQRRVTQLREQGAGASVRGQIGAAAEAYRASHQHTQAAAETTKGTWGDELGGIASHPPVKKRLKRLQALGAVIAAEPKPKRLRMTLPMTLREVVLTAVLVPLMAFMLYLLLCVMVAVFLFGVVSATIFMGLAMPLIYRLII